MKSSRLLTSCAAASLFSFIAACSSSSDKGGSGGSSNEGGSSGTGGAATGGSTASSGGSTVSGSGGKSAGGDAGTHKDGGAASGGTSSLDGGDASTGAGGAPATCQADLQTDPLNCGSCGKSCAGGDCEGGLCVPVLVLDTEEPPYGFHTYEWQTFINGGKAYLWEKTTANSNHYKLLDTSTTPATPAATGTVLQDVPFPPEIASVAFDATYLYAAAPGATVGTKGQVTAKKLADQSAPTKLFTLPAGPPDPNNGNAPSDFLWQNMSVTSTAIYLTATTQINGFSNPNPDSSAIYRIATPVTDATKTPTQIVSGLGEVVTDLAVFGDHVFWLDYKPSRPDSDAGPGTDYFVYTAPAAGGTPVRLDDANTSTSSFTSDGTYVYWIEANDAGRLMRCPLANLDTAHVKSVSDASSAQEGIVAQGQYVFFVEFSDPGPIFRVNTSTGARDVIGNRDIGASEKESRILGADANFLYLAGIDAKIYRLPSTP
jgi:hypothetical protein